MKISRSKPMVAKVNGPCVASVRTPSRTTTVSAKGPLMASVSAKELDEDFDKDIEISEEDFDSKPENVVESKFGSSIDDSISYVEKAIDALVDGSNASKRISENAEKSVKEIVKNLAVVLADLQLAKSEVGPIV